MAISDIRKRATAKPTLWRTCATCDLLDSLSKPEAADLRALLADNRVRYGWLQEQLHKDGKDVEWVSLSRHARGKCAAHEKLRGDK